LNIMGHKSHDMVSFPLGIPNVKVCHVRQNDRGDYIITVESTRKGTVCQHCGRKITKFNGHGRWIKLRHLPILGHRVYIRIRPKRYECPYCDGKTSTQRLDWYDTKSPHTKAYDRHLMVQMVNSTVEDVSRKEDVGYDAIEGVIERYVHVGVNWDEFDELGVIGIDEIALTKGRRNFVAVITTQQADGHVAVLAVLPDRKKKTVRRFLETIPQRLWGTMETACTDMWEGYVNALKEFAAAHSEVSLNVVVDRYHVAKNYRACVDKVRKQERRRLKKVLPATEYDENVKGTMWIIRKNHQDLTTDECKQLNRLFEYSSELKLAYTLRQELTALFELQMTKAQAKKRLLKWRDKVRRTALTCFDEFLTTLNNWLDEILNYFVDRLSSGFVEGLNNKIKTIKRRCYGITRVTTLFQRLYLDLEGYRRFA
jgi:transposase